jgi:hypothetical protein
LTFLLWENVAIGSQKIYLFLFKVFKGTGIHNLMPHLPILYFTTPQFNFGHGVNWIPNFLVNLTSNAPKWSEWGDFPPVAVK